jgi:transposase
MDGNTRRRAKAADRRAVVLDALGAGTITLAQAVTLLGLSPRQVKRLRAAYREAGAAGLAHGNRGRVPWNALDPVVRERLLELARTRYAGFNAQHLAERLAEDEGLVLHPTTVRRLLVAAGQRPARIHRVPAHRSRRERMPREGLRLQGDGSRHRWLGEDASYLTLIGFIDDATGTIPAAVFRAQEDAAGYLLVLREIACTKGRPTAVYVDRHGIFAKSVRDPLTLGEERAGGPLPTQVARALDELGVRLILAQSPQAKGRIERLWRTLQDRLVVELHLAGITTLDDANAFLPRFLDRFNARFAVPTAEAGSAYRPLPDDLPPDRIFCFKYERVVRPDNTVTFGHRVLQLQPTSGRASWVRARVEVHERLDNSLAVYYQDTLLITVSAPPDAPTLRTRAGPRPGAGAPQAPTPAPFSPSLAPATQPRPRPTWKPGPQHPWRRSLVAPPPPDPPE